MRFNKVAGTVRESFFRTVHSLRSARSPGVTLSSMIYLIGLLMIIPTVYVVVRSLEADSQKWATLFDTRIPILLSKTLSLTVTVAALAVILGVGSAILVTKTDLPGKKWWRILLIMPFTMPSYVGAMAYIIILGPRGWMVEWFGTTLPIYSFWGTVFVMTGFTYPYVFLVVSAALRKMSPSFEDVGLSSGYTPLQTLRKVTLPLLRPAIGSGALLVALYVVSDFGAVAMLRYPTFTQAIYFQMGSFDRSGSAILSVILIGITLLFLGLQSFSNRKVKFYQVGTSDTKERTLLQLGHWKPLALFFIATLFFLFAVSPTLVLIYWTVIGWTQGAIGVEFLQYMVNTGLVGIITAAVCLCLALPLVYVKTRFHSLPSIIVNWISYTGYALPGIIIALGVIFIYLQYIPWFYGTLVMLITAYVIRFLPQALQGTEATMRQISPSLDDAAMTLGKSPFQTMIHIIFKLVRPGMIAGATLVMINTMKELPATLLLRPIGFDTLPVRVWIEASEAYYDKAAPSALLLILISFLSVRWLIKKY